MTRFRSLIIAAALVMVSALPAFAQTTLNSTTTSAAVTATQQIIPLTAVTNIAVKDWGFLDRELVQVNAIDTTAKTITVKRGNQGTRAEAHANTTVVWTGVPSRFYGYDVHGTCTATSESFLPHINPGTKNVSDCLNSEWVPLRVNGQRVALPGRNDGGSTYTANGAITVQPGISFINGTTLAMTLADPTQEQNGMIMIILATNASAHTVTYTTGFGGGTTARDVATFGGAINDGFVIVAFNKVWWAISTRNVTFG